MRIHDILGFIKTAYGKGYAENTRETVRRQVLHQFEQARLVDRNPDDLTLPTNSPRTHYALTDDALDAIRAYGRHRFLAAVQAFRSSHGALLEVYRAARRQRMVAVQLPSELELALSPGKHNELQAAVVREFRQYFAPRTSVLYLGDTANKTLHQESAELEGLGVPVSQHDKLPDLILFDGAKKVLFLIEAVTSHGPISPKRLRELEAFLGGCPAARVYITAFPDLAEFKRHISNIA